MDVTEQHLLADSETCVIESIDTEKRTGVLTMITEGFSLNGRRNKKNEFIPRYYTRKSVGDVADAAQSRFKIFAGHELDPLKRMDRNIKELVATIAIGEDGKRQTWTEENANGKLQAKARIRFSHYDVGQQTMLEARDDINSVRASINGIAHTKLDGEAEGQPADTIEGLKFLFSPDIVSYDAAGGGMSNMESVSEGFVDLQESPTEPTKKEEPRVHARILEAYKSLKQRMKDRELMEKWWDITSSFNTIMREIVIDKDKEYETVDAKKNAFDSATTELKEVIFSLDIDALGKQMDEHVVKENTMFDTVEKAAQDANVVRAVLEGSEEFKNLHTKVSELTQSVESLTADKTKEKDRADQAEAKLKAEEAVEIKREVFERVRQELKLPDKYVNDDLRGTCITYENDELPENYAELTDQQKAGYRTAEQKMRDKVKAHKEWCEGLGAKPTGNTFRVKTDPEIADEETQESGTLQRGSQEYTNYLKSVAAQA